MISFSFQPLLALSADEQAVLANPVVTWAAVLAKFAFGMLDAVSRRYHAAAREFNLRKRKGRAGRPRARLSAEKKAAEARVEAPAGVVCPADSVALGAEAHPATTGRSPKPFHSMAMAFLATAIDDKPAAPEHVHRMLHGNPTFAARCGFEYPGSPKGRRSRRLTIPALRTLHTFDQVMGEYGFWSDVRLALVRQNLGTGAVEASDALVADTTHFQADSTPRVVELPAEKKKASPTPPKQREVVTARAACNKKRKAVAARPAGKGKRKETRKVRISRLTKRCRHEDHNACNCPWIEGDAGAGVVVKSSSKQFWAHKVAFIGFAGTTVPLDIAVVNCASAHDSTTLEPHLDRLCEVLPEVFDGVTSVIADPSYDEAPARERIPQNFGGLVLNTKINPRARKEAPMPGHDSQFTLSPQGQPVCLRKLPLVLVGRDEPREEYIWRGPLDDKGAPLCKGCPFAAQCGLKGKRRTVRVPRATTPQIDWNHPQHLLSEQVHYRQRTAVERQIERVKGPLERNRLPCRGRVRVQSFLDLRLAALHALIAFT